MSGCTRRNGHYDTHKVGKRKALIKWYDIVEGLDLLRRKGDVESLDVLVQMLYFATADDRENIRCFLQEVCDRHYEMSIKSVY